MERVFSMTPTEMHILCVKITSATISTFLFPSINIVIVLLLFHLLDIVSAIRLGRRLKKYDPEKYTEVKFSSEKFKSKMQDYGFEVLILAAATIMNVIFFPDYTFIVWLGFLFMGGQAVSILENESECRGVKWATWLQKILKSKASRYLKDKLGVDEDVFT